MNTASNAGNVWALFSLLTYQVKSLHLRVMKACEEFCVVILAFSDCSNPTKTDAVRTTIEVENAHWLTSHLAKLISLKVVPTPGRL